MFCKKSCLQALLLLMGLVLSGCGGGGGSTTDTSTGTSVSTGASTGTSIGTPGTATTTVVVSTPTASTTANVLCSYAQSVFNSSASVSATSTAIWSCNSTGRMLSANGLPDHAVGIFPNANNPNKITAQRVSASLFMNPTVSSTVTQRGGPLGDTGYILNGVKVDAATAGSCDNTGANCGLVNNTGAWSIEALGQTAFNFGTDSNNAHVQPNGAYHYHGIPVGFVNALGKGIAMTLIGWAADGFPIYARYGYNVASNAASPVRVITSSYRLKLAPSANRPSTLVYALGTFSQDYEYVAGSGDLDECNGRTGVTPEFPSGIYHYYATDSYPYLQRCVKGRL